jgi:hypothetical protein
MGFRDSFLVIAVIFMLGLIPAWIMGRAPRKAEGQRLVSSGPEGEVNRRKAEGQPAFE